MTKSPQCQLHPFLNYCATPHNCGNTTDRIYRANTEDYTPTSYENDLDGGTYESDLEAEAVLRERELEDHREEWSLGFSIDSDGHWHEHQRSPIYQTSPPLTKEEVDDIRESLEAGNAAATQATGAATTTTTSLSSIMYCG